jgi:ureidoacrylate peracid hydrolase
VKTHADDLLLTLEQKVAPAYAALIVVDVQNDFAADGGFFDKIGGDMAVLQRAVPPLVRLIERARAAGVLVVFIRAIYDPEYLSPPMRERNIRNKLDMSRCLTGSWGADFYVVEPRAGEPIVIKHRYSAFMGTELDGLLKQRGIQSLLLTGVATDVCVESTARDAYFLDYYVTVIADCSAAARERYHLDALDRCDRDYGGVATSADVITAWERIGALPVPPPAASRGGG